MGLKLTRRPGTATLKAAKPFHLYLGPSSHLSKEIL